MTAKTGKTPPSVKFLLILHAKKIKKNDMLLFRTAGQSFLIKSHSIYVLS